MSNICCAFFLLALKNAIFKWASTNSGCFCSGRTKAGFYRSIKHRGVMEKSLTWVSKHILKDCILFGGHHSLKVGENSSGKELTLNGKQTSKQMVRWLWLLLVYWTTEQKKTHLPWSKCVKSYWKNWNTHFLLFLFNGWQTNPAQNALSRLCTKGQWSGNRAWMFDETAIAMITCDIHHTSNCRKPGRVIHSLCTTQKGLIFHQKKANMVLMREHKVKSYSGGEEAYKSSRWIWPCNDRIALVLWSGD